MHKELLSSFLFSIKHCLRIQTRKFCPARILGNNAIVLKQGHCRGAWGFQTYVYNGIRTIVIARLRAWSAYHLPQPFHSHPLNSLEPFIISDTTATACPKHHQNVRASVFRAPTIRLRRSASSSYNQHSDPSSRSYIFSSDTPRPFSCHAIPPNPIKSRPPPCQRPNAPSPKISSSVLHVGSPAQPRHLGCSYHLLPTLDR